MKKKEGILVFLCGAVLLAVFTFTDLQISMALATKPWIARALEVVGEIPFEILTLAGLAMLLRFYDREKKVKGIVTLMGAGILFLLFSFMGGFMTWNYLCKNVGDISPVIMVLVAVVMALVAVWIAKKVPEEKRQRAVRFAVTALIYFVLVLIVMNTLKTMWGRMRFREMADPTAQFTRWYEICGRGAFSDAYASFPSGHSMNSAGIILLLLLPDLIPALEKNRNALRVVVYVWCAAVGFSRVLMGAHFASDVTVGILLSLLLFEIVSTVVYRKERS